MQNMFKMCFINSTIKSLGVWVTILENCIIIFYVLMNSTAMKDLGYSLLFCW